VALADAPPGGTPFGTTRRQAVEHDFPRGMANTFRLGFYYVQEEGPLFGQNQGQGGSQNETAMNGERPRFALLDINPR